MKSREHVTTNGRAVFFAAMWEDLKKAALSHGWALGLHGSLSSDMDIMAMPWDEHANSADLMIAQLCLCFTEGAQIENNIQISHDKPNNRTVYTLPIWADFYLDINIITAPTEDKKAPVEEDKITCKHCNGVGKHQVSDIDYDDCRTCNGYGYVIKSSFIDTLKEEFYKKFTYSDGGEFRMHTNPIDWFVIKMQEHASNERTKAIQECIDIVKRNHFDSDVAKEINKMTLEELSKLKK